MEPAECGAQSQCQWQPPQEPTTITVEFSAFANLAFVSSESFLPFTLGGAVQADALCTRAAARAHLAGPFVAAISTEHSSAVERLGGARGWLRMDGKPFMKVFEYYPSYYPLRLDEHGMDVGNVRLLTATFFDGTFSAEVGSCGGWQDANGTFASGLSACDRGWEIGGGSASCATPGHLACLGVTTRYEFETPPVLPPNARLAFLVDFLAFDAATRAGAASIDALCQEIAQAAGRPGTFVAWLADVGVSAMERTPLSVGTWVRPDGVVVLQDTLPTGPWQAAVDVTANGDAFRDYVWLGARQADLPGTVETTCNGWVDWGRPGATEAGVEVENSAGEYYDVPLPYLLPCIVAPFPPAFMCLQK